MQKMNQKFKQGSRALVLGCLGLSLMCAPTLASAEEGGVHYQLGIKSFLTDFKSTTDTTSNNYKSSNSVLLVGPSLNIVGKNMFAGVTYLYPTESLKIEGTSTTIDRQDLDVYAGFKTTSENNFTVGFVLGYKGIYTDYNYSDSSTAKEYYHGLMFGVPLSYRLPIDALPIIVYATPGYGVLYGTFERSDGTKLPEETYLGLIVDGGVKAVLWRGLGANIGYKYQYMETDAAAGENFKLQFQGLTAGVDYTF